MPEFDVAIYHNHDSRFSAYREGHTLERVFEYADSGDDVDRVCNHAYHMFNAPEEFLTTDEGLLAVAYRERGLRSLSVGDVVVVGETAWACEPLGWKRVHLTAEQVTA
ncbi:hypothetical protein SEA_ALEEMILY_139 [Gordonia phage Aleemily]|uniref:Uncharacterized protein n=1 Tax=Gordonia phage Aleemily TaxID=2965181 RepID=A0A9E7QC35_9CAUD|nr:hypothetical protein SEA_ALEEMILY_139 [Gordonia phage Aleemily]